MEVSALKYSGGIGLHGRATLLRLQSDERLIAYLRKGNTAAFEVLLARYETRLQAFCRHLLGSREDAEDVMQEVMTAAFNAILADERPINVRPWLYRIARNRSLNHLRRARAIAVDTMDTQLSEHGASTADKVHEREEFRLLVGDIHELPESQKTALVLREMDALSYEQIAEAMETTVSSVKSLLVRARVSLAEAAEARLLSCDEVRIELGEVAEGLRRRPSPLVRRHLRSCERCSVFRTQLRQTNKALAALMPIGPLVILKKLALFHLGHSAGSGAGASGAAGAGAAGAGAAGAGATGAAAGGTALAGSSAGFMSAGIGALAGKAAVGLAAAAIVTAGAVEANHPILHHAHHTIYAAVPSTAPAQQAALVPLTTGIERRSSAVGRRGKLRNTPARAAKAATPSKPPTKAAASPAKGPATTAKPASPDKGVAGRTQTQTDPTVLPTPSGSSTTPGGAPSSSTAAGGSAPSSGSGAGTSPPPSSPSASSPPPSSPPPSSPPSGGSPLPVPPTTTPVVPPSTVPPSTVPTPPATTSPNPGPAPSSTASASPGGAPGA